ncbi:MAG: methyltransferase domain-containing protein [Acidobacteriia bacterium]|nr:methyltransferase domain-containing protein [Terriglobia bacterium]
MKKPESDAHGRLREEFNRWAEEGSGEEMEEHHLPIVEPTLALMNLQPVDRVLDVGCGTGWLGKRLAALGPGGQVVGIDVSDEMVRRAQQAGAGFGNLTFLRGSVDRIPWESGYFTKVISVESAYYWPDPASGLREIFRVLAPGGSAWILINYYRDNPHCHQWGAQYNIPAHLLTAGEWARIFSDPGFTDVAHRRIPDNSPTPEVYTGRWFKDAEQMRKFKREGALLISGQKPLAT